MTKNNIKEIIEASVADMLDKMEVETKETKVEEKGTKNVEECGHRYGCCCCCSDFKFYIEDSLIFMCNKAECAVD